MIGVSMEKNRTDAPKIHHRSRRMLQRTNHRQALETSLGRSPVTALVGPRQCAKTTLARMVASGRRSIYLDLEAPTDRQRLQNPGLVLGEVPDLVVLDGIQSMPELFAGLRVLVDRDDRPGRFLILGSASAAISRDVAESLAGRVEVVELSGFDLSGTGASQLQTLWVRGGLPAPVWPPRKWTAPPGEKSSSGGSSSATSRNWESRFRRLR